MSDFRTDPLSCEGCPLASISIADCRHTSNEDCREVIEWLDEHDAEIRSDVMNDEKIPLQLLNMGYKKGREEQTKRIFDDLFELLEGPAYNQCLLMTYQALKDMYREYMEDRR